MHTKDLFHDYTLDKLHKVHNLFAKIFIYKKDKTTTKKKKRKTTGFQHVLKTSVNLTI